MHLLPEAQGVRRNKNTVIELGNLINFTELNCSSKLACSSSAWGHLISKCLSHAT